MSDTMLYGVLRMPYEMAMADDLSRYQFWQRVQEAADRLEAAERATPPSPSTASEGSELRDAAQSVLDRYDELRGDRQPAAEFEILRAALASKQVAREVECERQSNEITRLDLMSLIRSQMHRVYASAIDREEIDSNYMREIEDALRVVYASADAASRCRAQGGDVLCIAAEVDVEAERKLYLKEFPSYLGFGWTGRQQDEFKVWLAARRTQEGAKDMERLDWMARHGAALRSDPKDGRWYLDAPYHTGISSVDDYQRFESAREAIDAAIAATQTKESPN